MNKNKFNVKKLTYLAMFTAIVAVLQYLGGFIKFGMFSVSLVLIPIVVGTAICGVLSGAWLGLVFAIMVFVTGDAAFFLSINVAGTIITVVVKGVLAGLCAGLVYKLLEHVNKYLATIAAAIVCPVVNTGVFLLGCRLFFMDAVTSWAVNENVSVGVYMILFLAGANFLFELLFNVVLSPVAVRIINIGEKK